MNIKALTVQLLGYLVIQFASIVAPRQQQLSACRWTFPGCFLPLVSGVQMLLKKLIDFFHGSQKKNKASGKYQDPSRVTRRLAKMLSLLSGSNGLCQPSPVKLQSIALSSVIATSQQTSNSKRNYLKFQPNQCYEEAMWSSEKFQWKLHQA